MEEYFLQFEGWILLPLGFCAVLLLTQLFIILVVHGPLAFHKSKSIVEPNDQNPSDQVALPALSVIICTRNQENELKLNLISILEQQYPRFEVIVVNDRSDDDTKWVLRDLQALHPQLKVVEIAEHVLSRQGKKFGVAMGIKAAEFDHVVLTDVTCTPSSDRWLLHLGTNLMYEGAEIVLGYVPLQRKKGGFSKLIRYAHFQLSVDYLAAALRGNAYMGLGQNMAYAKELFFQGKGFASHIHVSAGYDELFVNQHARHGNTRLAIHKDAHVWKPMEVSAEAFFIQRNLQREAARLYKGWDKFKLNLQVFSTVLFYVMLTAMVLAVPSTWPLVVGAYALRLLIQYLIYLPIAGKLRITRMMWFLPVLDLLHTFYLGLHWYGGAKKTNGALWS